LSCDYQHFGYNKIGKKRKQKKKKERKKENFYGDLEEELIV
jgi:hypothetical protein